MSTLRVKLDGQDQDATPLGVNGLLLICSVPSRQGQTVIPEFQALDKQQFWRTWEAMGGEQQGILIGETAEAAVPFVAPCFAQVEQDLSRLDQPLSWWQRLIAGFVGWLFPWLKNPE